MEKDTKKINTAACAHIGDAVYELFIREIVDTSVQKISTIHKYTTSFVCAGFQEKMLFFLEEYLTDEEKEIARRARNLPLTKKKTSNQKTHRHATAFEAILGYQYLNDKARLQELFDLIKQNIVIKA